MTAMTLLLWVSAYSSFAWGVLRFFRRGSALGRRTMLVGGLGLFFGVGHAAAIAIVAPRSLRASAAAALFACSVLLFWWAVRACQSHRPGAIFGGETPSTLVQGGPYGYIRHPFYASYTLFWFAGWIDCGSMAILVSAVIMLTIYLEAIRNEEGKFASSLLAGDYARYRERTGAMTPRLSGLVNRLLCGCRRNG